MAEMRHHEFPLCRSLQYIQFYTLPMTFPSSHGWVFYRKGKQYIYVLFLHQADLHGFSYLLIFPKYSLILILFNSAWRGVKFPSMYCSTSHLDFWKYSKVDSIFVSRSDIIAPTCVICPNILVFSLRKELCFYIKCSSKAYKFLFPKHEVFILETCSQNTSPWLFYLISFLVF